MKKKHTLMQEKHMQNIGGDIKGCNYWTNLSIKYVNNNNNYLDKISKIYTINREENRKSIPENIWSDVEKYYKNNDNKNLLLSLLKFEIFPIKDSYVAYLRITKEDGINDSPETVERICNQVYKMGLGKIYEKCSEPKETNRQMGQSFKNWIKKGTLGFPVVNIDEFSKTKTDAILDASDATMQEWCRNNLNYARNKGLDFVARKNNRYVIGEAKFISDDGGNQNGQFLDAVATLEAKNVNATIIAILDGVLYIPSNRKIHKSIVNNKHNILSALLLKDFMYSL
jgi:hypothetical protein